jgi:hypothetical protein
MAGTRRHGAPYERLSLSIPPAVIRRLEMQADLRMVSRSALVLRALEAFLPGLEAQGDPIGDSPMGYERLRQEEADRIEREAYGRDELEARRRAAAAEAI